MDIRFVLLALTAASLLISSTAHAWQQDDFIITCWCPPTATEQNMAVFAKDGYNLGSARPEELDNVAKHNLKALLLSDLFDSKTLDDPVKTQELDALIKRVKDHPALAGYHLTDEPGAGAFPSWGRMVAFIRERDPKHLAYINLFPTYATPEQLGVSADEIQRAKVGQPDNFAGAGTSADTIAAYREHLRGYLEIVKPELISYDHYHFLQGSDGEQYFLNLALIREAAQKSKLPFLNIIQACTIVPSWRLVNKDELRFLVYTTLAYGGRGISYFLHSGPKEYGGLYQEGVRMPLADDVAALNRELKVIGKELMKHESCGVYHTDPLPIGGEAVPKDSTIQVSGGEFVLGLFDNKSFMVVNRDYRKARVAKITLPPSTAAVREFVRSKGKWVGYASRDAKSLTVRLKPGDGRLFRMVLGM